MVRKLGAGPGDGVAVDVIASVRSNTSAGCDAAGFDVAFGGASSSASMASISSWLLAAAAGVGFGAGGTAGLAGGAGGGAAAAGCLAGGAGSGAEAAPLAGLPASSSAIIRRMEARISSIDGSCAFAVCVIP